jgi:lysophospholipase L1-like esterase
VATKSLARWVLWLSLVLCLVLSVGLGAAPGYGPMTPALSAPAAQLLPSDRSTDWDPGLNSTGGIPNRAVLCATVQASSYGDGAQDATAGIQWAINSCPVDQVVQLSAGNFSIGTGPVRLNKGVTLRGAGPTQTHLTAPNGKEQPIVIMGFQWPKPGSSVDLTLSAVKGTRSAAVSSTAGLTVGEIVLIDELTDTSITEWSPKSPPGDPSRGWFSRYDRPLSQTMEIASIAGNSVTFTTPFHINFDTSHSAQLSRFHEYVGGPIASAVKNAGLEDLHLYGGEGYDNGGNIYMELAAYCWVKNVDSENSAGGSIHLFTTFRSVVRDSYFHEAKITQPGGGAYGIDLARASADNLIENNISWNFNKVMNLRATGGGNVIAYNYMDDGWIDYDTGWVETGLNPAHMTTPHYELFEGNQAFNFEPDNTWGNSIYITAFRNHLTGQRRSISPLSFSDAGNRVTVGMTKGHWWYSFLGNVLGFPGMSSQIQSWYLGFNPEDWNQPPDPMVLSTIIRGGNYEYATNQIIWENIAEQSLPASLYLTSKPSFFGGYTWPWVDPTGATKLYTLPARERFDVLKGIIPPPAATPSPTGGPGGPDALLIINRNVPAFASSLYYPAANSDDADDSTDWRSSAIPDALPIISRNVPAFASSLYYPAANANDADYGTDWRSSVIPAWLAYDLSGVSPSRRAQVVAVYYNGSYGYSTTYGPHYNNAAAYTLEAHAAPGGGSPPACGWVTLATLAGNTYHSRQHIVNLTGYNWLRINVTASDGSAGNTDVSLNLDVHDASAGVEDDWIFYGDSITAAGMSTVPVAGVGTFRQLVGAQEPGRTPVQEGAGMPFQTATDGADRIGTWLAMFPGHYVGLSFGTNDAGAANPAAFYTSYRAMIDAVLAAGKIPVVPKIPWARTSAVQTNGPAYNAEIDHLYATYPQIVRGPDFWTFYQQNQHLISSDNLHPSEPGYAAYRQQWANLMVTTVYRGPGQ